MDMIKISGSHFDIGYQLGLWGKTTFEDAICQTTLWKTINLLSNSKQAMEMQDIVKKNYANYWQELEGMAAGLKCDFNKLFAWNCRGDLVPSTSDGCTTVMTKLKDGTIMVAHNEDGFPTVKDRCAIVEIQSDSGGHFISFAYPGSICGHTFAINQYGLVITVNNIRAVNRPIGIPRQILGRASLDAKTVQEAINVLTNQPRSGAFHHAVAKASENRLVSIETTGEASSIKDVDTTYYHSNHLIHPNLLSIQQIITDSSRSRYERLLEWGKAVENTQLSGKDLITILSDKKNQSLPIYRQSPDDPDEENTLATALFILKNDIANWSIFTDDRKNPILSNSINTN